MAAQRSALVTGGSRGIGLACVQRLLADGFCVAVADINERALAEARTVLAAEAERLLFVTASVTDRAAMAAVAAQIAERWGRLDALVNNAGVNRPGGLLAQSDADWDAVLAINLKGPFVCSAVCLPHMRGRAGAIVHIGSIGAAGMGASPAYAASKAGLIGLARQMARELGPEDITVNVVAPGVTRTGWVERNLGEERIRAAGESVPLGRVTAPEEIAGAVAFLCGPDARQITGQVLSVSGGAWMVG
ncbi:MAG TPA: SDR family NAD(P)-dependent oxidoreductase [Dehalococcoidia bacterium]|jgi:NAD(P)-dependent dehydrogenase (short-subunit alcohol dehydrogenase family)